jgi:hypothetical protein
VGLSLASPRALKPIIPAVEGVNASEGVAWAALYKSPARPKKARHEA